MKPFDDRELRELLSCYEVNEPSSELLENTKRLMHEEMLHPATEPLIHEKWIFALVGLAVVLSLCLFYIFTIGTILRYVLPSYLLDFFRHTLYALTAAGGSILICALMMFFFKQFTFRAEESLNNLQ